MAKITTNGDLRTPVTFYTSRLKEGIDGRDTWFERVFDSMAEVYNPSLKDIEISNTKGVRSRLTIKIRDPLAGYVPDLKHMVAVHDPRFVGQKFHIIDIRPDFVTREFLTIVLGERVHG